MLLLLILLGVLLFSSNSPSVSLLFSLVFSLMSGVLVSFPPSLFSESGDSLFGLLGVLVYSGGVFVMMSFVIFSSHSDFEKPLSNVWGWSVLSFLLYLLSSSDGSSGENSCLHLFSGEYLLVFFFVLLLLFSILFSIFSISEEKKESFFL